MPQSVQPAVPDLSRKSFPSSTPAASHTHDRAASPLVYPRSHCALDLHLQLRESLLSASRWLRSPCAGAQFSDDSGHDASNTTPSPPTHPPRPQRCLPAVLLVAPGVPSELGYRLRRFMSSYRLEAPRAARPSPIATDKPSEPLLYNLPVAHSTSPPTSPTSRPTSPRSPRSRLASPTSPTRSRTPVSGRPAPSPTARNRSATPLGVSSGELDKFAEYCRAWYFDQDDNSGRLMTQTLANLPSAQRAPYSRDPECYNPRGESYAACTLQPQRKRGKEGTIRTVRKSLWAIMRLQIVPETIGGAGRNVICWEFDDAVLRESAGRDFMVEAIDVLKGVLAFTETPSSKRVSGLPGNYQPSNSIHARSQSQPLSAKPPPTTVQPKRARAPSDPFLDTPAPSHSLSSSPASHDSALLGSTTPTDDIPPSQTPPINTTAAAYYADDPGDDVEDQEYLRVWTSPDLSNPEYVDLLKLFPSFLTRRTLPRFPATTAKPPQDVEQGLTEDKILQFGTGSMWVSSIPRSDGYEGSFWARFVLWWKRVFC
uniref:Uncharacterized protein n=1 Tax=Mycena chlorophos TaxID=658473 RepID=A0ABQ0L0F4_MYCCL|nr:predicted protein [Mycena chlorophos]